MTRAQWILRSIGSGAVTALVAGPGTAGGETQRSFPVTATIVKGCVVSTDGTSQLGRIDFGTVAGTARGTVDAAMVSPVGAGIALECTPDTNVTLAADMGEHAAGGTRRLGLNGGSTSVIAYQIFATGSSTPWTSQSLALSFSQGATARTVPVLGRATLTGAMAAGSYSDTIRVTIAW